MNSELKRGERQIACPFCNSTETELFALFGQFLLASQYYCRHCRTVFDVVRWEDDAPSGDSPAPSPGESRLEPTLTSPSPKPQSPSGKGACGRE